MGGGSELSDQLLDPDVPTLASQDKLKVSPKGLPFVKTQQIHVNVYSIISTHDQMWNLKRSERDRSCTELFPYVQTSHSKP